ncbi:MAG: FAD:protein FMN transferase [Lachnospiraceae bacterium]
MFLCIAIFLCSTVETGCGKENRIDKKVDETAPASIDFFAMDTYMTLTAYGEHAEEAVKEAKKKILELDQKLSIGDTNSEISKVNKNGKAVVSQEVYDLFQRSRTLSEDTNGAFQPLLEPVMELWGFTSGEYQVPKEQDLKKCLELANLEKVNWKDETCEIVFSEKGMKADLGGIAKGYTADEVMRIFREKGVEHAVISLGGNTQTLGEKPDGSAWRVAIENPEEKEKYLGVVEVKNKAVVTSGGYERYFEKNGKIYHHIIDPQTGYPAENGLISVSIISADGTLADGLSTALYVMGLEKATTYWREHSDEFDAVLETTDGELYVTQGIEKEFTSEKKIQLLKK